MGTRMDFTIVGGGILGFSIGNAILEKYSSAKVLILEKEGEFGFHASGRNSGVLHAGFYYSPDSLKAKFCRDGNLRLKNLISKHNIPLKETGKVVVSKNIQDEKRMDDLFERGLKNGVKLERLPAGDLNRFEPMARTFESFLWSPNTSVSDPAQVLRAIREEFLKKGGKSICNNYVKVDLHGKVCVDDTALRSTYFINAAGTGALKIAQKLGVGYEYAQLPILGRYKVTERKNLPLQTLVYPVPNPRNPFLGVHFTLTLDGNVKIGPTAIPVFGSEQYQIFNKVSSGDFFNSLKSLQVLLRNSAPELLRLGIQEYPKLLNSKLVRDGKKFVPGASNSYEWKSKRPGIRAQLVNIQNGTFEQDFIVEKSGNFVHILNAVSPGWTSAIPFAEWIVESNF